MSMSVVCAHCIMLQESASGELPKGWRQTQDGYLCSRCCAIAGEDGANSDVLEEELIYPLPEEVDDTVDDFYCEVCCGPCQGH